MDSRTERVRTLCTLALTVVLAGALLAGLLLPWVGGPAIAAAEPRGLHRLYVVLTRAVSTLVVLHTGDLPELLAA